MGTDIFHVLCVRTCVCVCMLRMHHHISIMTTIHHQLRICRRCSRLFRCSIFYSRTPPARRACVLFFAMQCIRARVLSEIYVYSVFRQVHTAPRLCEDDGDEPTEDDGDDDDDATATEQMFFANECNRPKYLRTCSAVYMNTNGYTIRVVRQLYSTPRYIKYVWTHIAPEHTTHAYIDISTHSHTSHPQATDHHCHTYTKMHILGDIRDRKLILHPAS